jgi:hypothetical protein
MWIINNSNTISNDGYAKQKVWLYLIFIHSPYIGHCREERHLYLPPSYISNKYGRLSKLYVSTPCIYSTENHIYSNPSFAFFLLGRISMQRFSINNSCLNDREEIQDFQLHHGHLSSVLVGLTSFLKLNRYGLRYESIFILSFFQA